MVLESSPLGKNSSYCAGYAPELLFPIPRSIKRDEIAVPHPLPFLGTDIWNGYELSWLNNKGKPEIAIAEFSFPCTSPCIIESKSFKLYLNSFNQTRLAGGIAELQGLLERDLSKAAGAPVGVKLILPNHFDQIELSECPGQCIDYLDIETDTYTICTDFLQLEPSNGALVEETLYSNLLKSNCLVTGQPDWATVWLHYVGPMIDREGLLKYLISFRNHNEFHEQCIERIFMDLMRHCQPQKLEVYGRYTRRGGLDINPYRSNFDGSAPPANIRNSRQ